MSVIASVFKLKGRGTYNGTTRFLPTKAKNGHTVAESQKVL